MNIEQGILNAKVNLKIQHSKFTVQYPIFPTAKRYPHSYTPSQ